MSTSSSKKAPVGKTKTVTKIEKNENWFVRSVNSQVQRFGLPFGIFLAITFALLMTVASMALYIVGGTAKLDLSRPGYESVRSQIRQDDGYNDDFSSTGEINKDVIKDFLKMYDSEAKSLGQYDDFDRDILGDSQIGLTAEQVSPSDGAINP